MNEKSIEEILAERQLKEFNESKFGQFFNNQNLNREQVRTSLWLVFACEGLACPVRAVFLS